MPATDLPVQPMAVDFAGAARLIDMSRSHFYSVYEAGEIGPMAHKVGGKRLICVEELRQWCRHGMPSRGQWGPMWEAIRREGAR